MSNNTKGQPSGTNKNEGPGILPPNDNHDEKMREKYEDLDPETEGNKSPSHPNRNTDKPDATNAGGYKQ